MAALQARRMVQLIRPLMYKRIVSSNAGNKQLVKEVAAIETNYLFTTEAFSQHHTFYIHNTKYR